MPITLPPLALCWGSIRQADILQLASLASGHGFAEITVTAGQYRRVRDAGYSDTQLRDMLNAKGVTVSIVDPLMSVLPGVPAIQDVPEALRDGFDYTLDECTATAKALGARTINLAHFLGRPTALRDLADTVAHVASHAAESGLQVSLEFIPGTGVPTLAVAREIVALSGAPNAGVMFDTWHFLRSGGVQADLDDLKAGEILEIQLSDRRTPVPNEVYVPMTGRLAPGEGEAPLVGIIRAIYALSPNLVVGVEVFTAEEGDPDRLTHRLATTTRAVLEEAACF